MNVIFAGPTDTKFLVHKDLLVRKLPIFEALYKHREELKSEGPKFHAVNEFERMLKSSGGLEVVEVILYWIYNNKLPDLKIILEDDGSMVQSSDCPMVYAMVSMEPFECPALQDEIMDTFLDELQRLKYCIPLTMISDIFERDPPTSSCLRKLAVYSWWYLFDTNRKIRPKPSVDPYRDVFSAHPTLHADLFELLDGEDPAVQPFEMFRCEFHTHGKIAPCQGHQHTRSSKSSAFEFMDLLGDDAIKTTPTPAYFRE